MAKGVLEGDIGVTDRVANDFFQCLSCMNCKAACPSGVDTMKIFSAMRAQVYEGKGAGRVADFIFRRFLPYPRRLNALAKIVGLSTIFYKFAPAWLAKFMPFAPGGVKRVTPNFLQRNLRSRVGVTNTASKSSLGKKRRVIYYSGCMTDLAFPKTGKTVIDKLTQAGVEVVFPKEQVCCGAPSYYSGDLETSKKLARKNIEALNSIEADAIVYSCATCGSVLGEVYPELLPDDPAARRVADKMVDFQKYMAELGVEAVMLSKNGSGEKLKVTYHDPCHLNRGMGVRREPREILRNLPGVEFVEMEGSDRCCGGAGTFAIKHYGMSMDIGKFKVDAIKKSGADIVVTACPSCQLQLEDSLHRFGHNIPVMHTADLMDYVASGGLKRLIERRERKYSSASKQSAASANG